MRRLPLRHDWEDLDDEALLDVRMSDLPLAIEGTLAGRIARIREELEARDLRFPLHFYLADEWFTPDGATAIAVPFYLAHPRLARLEEAQMLEVE
ncbi:MAG: putative zinc-binding metallopeptidase, partial [Candidatus Rokuibacteriota bacterium]